MPQLRGSEPILGLNTPSDPMIFDLLPYDLTITIIIPPGILISLHLGRFILFQRFQTFFLLTNLSPESRQHSWKVLSLLSFYPWNYFDIPCTLCILRISNNSVQRILLKIKCFLPTRRSFVLVLRILLTSWRCAHLAPSLSFSDSL